MSFALLGQISVQGLWIYNSYEVNRELFQRELNTELSKIVLEWQGNQLHSILESSFFGEDSIWMNPHQNINKIKNQFISNQAIATQNVQILDALISEKLKERNLLIQPHYIALFKDNSPVKANVPLNDFYSTDFRSDKVQIGMSWQSKMQLQLAFPEAKRYFLTRMWLLLTVSIVLLLITFSAFLYMLQTIINQKRISEIKNDFMNNMTHELKTPIATVSVVIEALQHFDVLQNKARTTEYLEISANELKRLSMMVEKVLKMSAFERSEIMLNLEKMDINELIFNVLKGMKLQFERFNAKVEVDIDAREILIEADHIHITNVIYNLLDNALKYSHENPEIKISSYVENGFAFISVKDNGIGISDNHKSQIFEKFYRIPTGNVHNVKGFGLGLSYVHSIIKKHSGEIFVKSELNVGSEFIVKLPVISKQ
jgi:two-component system, OmpR family, phosphate regulon sensor histidine kinase PhoR